MWGNVGEINVSLFPSVSVVGSGGGGENAKLLIVRLTSVPGDGDGHLMSPSVGKNVQRMSLSGPDLSF